MRPAFPGNAPDSLNICGHFLERPAAVHPERIAAIAEAGDLRAAASQITYAQLAEMARAVAGAMSREGIPAGERVLIALPDSAEFIAAFLGVARTGAIAVPVNPLSRGEDFAHYLNDSRARLAIVHESVLAAFAPAAQSANALEKIILVPDASGEVRGLTARNWREWILSGNQKSSAPAKAADPAFFLYTSGSGGRPKAAIHAHKDMLAAWRGFAHGVLGITSADRTYSVSKLFFAYGLGNGMYFSLGAGATTVLDPEKPRPERTAAILAKHRPTLFFSVPTFYAALLREADRGLPLDFSSVRHAVSAGERLPPEIFERFRARTGLEIIDAIGSTEMLHMFLSPRPGKIRAGSCGTPIDGYEAQIVDDHGASVTEGEIGNLWVRGGGAFSGYWQIPELTSRTIRDGWVATNDKFMRDSDGYYHYCGRADDMMKVAGMWVSPTEVENALLGHPHVAEVAVVAEADAAGLVHPLAYVVLKNDASANAREDLRRDIRDFVHAKLPGYKCPKAIHFIEALPKTATGKIQRFKLREAAAGSSQR